MDLLELIDVDILVRLQTKFSDLLSLNVAFTGMDSRIIGMTDGRPTVPGSICELMRSNPEGEQRCYQSDLEAGLTCVSMGGKPLLYRCQCYFSNFVIPIKVSNTVIGFLYGGQFFCYRPDNTQEAEWEALKQETEAVTCTSDGRFIRAQFFHKDLGKPEERDLVEVGQKSGLTAVDRFIKMFGDQSEEETPNHKVKSATEVLRAISILSEVANTLSEQSNLSYALRLHFDTCERMTANQLHTVHKRVAGQYTALCRKLDSLLEDLKKRESEEDRLNTVQELEQISIGILQEVKEEERRRLSRARIINRFFYLKGGKD